jgi:hypothetical protein
MDKPDAGMADSGVPLHCSPNTSLILSGRHAAGVVDPIVAGGRIARTEFGV